MQTLWVEKIGAARWPTAKLRLQLSSYSYEAVMSFSLPVTSLHQSMQSLCMPASLGGLRAGKQQQTFEPPDFDGIVHAAGNKLIAVDWVEVLHSHRCVLEADR